MEHLLCAGQLYLNCTIFLQDRHYYSPTPLFEVGEEIEAHHYGLRVIKLINGRTVIGTQAYLVLRAWE